jgi:hypothetical protein
MGSKGKRREDDAFAAHPASLEPSAVSSRLRFNFYSLVRS